MEKLTTGKQSLNVCSSTFFYSKVICKYDASTALTCNNKGLKELILKSLNVNMLFSEVVQ